MKIYRQWSLSSIFIVTLILLAHNANADNEDELDLSSETLVLDLDEGAVADENTLKGTGLDENDENDAYDEDFDDMDLEVQELIFESPQDIEDLTNKALKDFALKIRKEEGMKGPGGYGTVCSKDEHCEEHEKCTSGGRCRPKNSTIPDACRYGLSTCLSKEGSPMRERAEQIIQKRLAIKPKTITQSLHSALLPAPAQNLMSLPPPKQLRQDNETSDKDTVIEAAANGENNGQLSASMAAYVESLALVDKIAEGAITGAGALPSNTKDWLEWAGKGKERKMRRPFRNYWDPQDRSYRIAQDEGERRALVNASKIRRKRQYPNNIDHELMEWFEKNGGKLKYAKPDGRHDGSRRLIAEENIQDEEDIILEVPFQITMNQMSVRNIKVGHTGRYLDEYIGGLFGKNQEWGLAAFLLFEISKGNRSKWYPMIRTLDMHILTSDVVKELEGTYVANRIRRWEEEAEDMHKFFEKVVGQKDHMGEVQGTWGTRKQLRWALWVARRHSVYVRKATTGKLFKAFVPFANYLTHKRGAGGKSIYTLNNKIQISVSATEEGKELYFDHGPFSDIETMIRHHEVDESSPNPNNQIIIGLPGARGPDGDDVFWEWTNMKEWRRAMKLPPKQSDLWRLADKLHLYGEEWDEEEQKAIAGMNINVKGLPLSLDQASVEEQLMLLGYAQTEEEAALIAYGGKKKMRDKDKTPQLYTALDPEEDERALKAVEEMSDAMMQLQEAVAAAHTDPSILKVINQTKDFFLYGIQPTRGLDDVDKLMTRKRTLVEQCGNMTDHYIYYNGVSTHLMCATRIHVMNETDVNTLCPMQGGAFWAEEKKCDGGGFNWTLPISEWNENITIQTIRDTVTILQKEYKTTIDEDENLLQLSTLPKITRAAIVVRKREKELLESVINYLDNRRANLSNLTHQIEGVRKLEKARKARLKEIAEFKERTRAQFSIPKKTVSFPIKLGKGNNPNFTVYEGQDLELMAAQFVQTHGLKEGLIKTIIKNARKRIRNGGELEFHTPIILDNGTRVCLRLYKGENITTAVRKIGAIYNITEAQLEIVIRLVKEKYEQRMSKKILVEFPVTVPDGRNIIVKVREGEEHDLVTHFRDLMMAMNMDIDYIQLANIAFQRLPPIAVKIPVEMSGKMTETYHYRQGQNPSDSIVAFCQYYGYTKETYTQLLNAVQQRLRL